MGQDLPGVVTFNQFGPLTMFSLNALRTMRVLAFVALLAGGLVSAYAVIDLVGESLPYQDAPPELLRAQAEAIARAENNFLVGCCVLMAGIVLLLVNRKALKTHQ